jgi:hypothetical protein
MDVRSKVILEVLAAAVITAAALVGAGKPGTASAAPAGSTVRGAIGGDFDAKLIWDAPNNGDSFIDAVWAYHYP